MRKDRKKSKAGFLVSCIDSLDVCHSATSASSFGTFGKYSMTDDRWIKCPPFPLSPISSLFSAFIQFDSL